MNKYLIMLLTFFLFSLTACSPEVGSEGWCNKLKQKSKGDWTASEAADFTIHCFFK
jgi:hypothetical protein